MTGDIEHPAQAIAADAFRTATKAATLAGIAAELRSPHNPDQDRALGADIALALATRREARGEPHSVLFGKGAP